MQPTQSGPNYGFIMQDPVVQKKSRLPGGGGLLSKIIFGGLGLIILFILISVVKNILIPGPNYAGFVTAAQHQQAIIQIVENANSQKGLSVPTQEIALMAQLAITNDQKEVLTYLSRNGQEVKPKELSLKLDATANQRLTSAATSSPAAYETAFREILDQKLKDYRASLEDTYKGFEGNNGRIVLDKAHTNSELLSKKLGTK